MNYVRTPLLLAVIAVVAAIASASAQERTYLYFYGGDVQTPGHPIVLNYETGADAEHPVRVVVYRLPQRRYVESIRKRDTELREQDVRDLPVAARGESRLREGPNLFARGRVRCAAGWRIRRRGARG